MLDKVRVRLAPSPTGYMHIGTLRTAIYNYLFAKKNNGKLILRIEDTDRTRYVEGAEKAIIEGLEWAGINLDEGPHIGGNYGPYIQTQRNARHLEVANELIEKGKAYRCFCTKERLAELKQQQEIRKMPPSYDRRCRNLSDNEIKDLLDKNTEYTIRLKMPLDGDIICEDIIRGKLKFPCKDLSDSIILKSDNLPTYHLAAMTDDHDMEISHIIRTEEWLPSTPLHVFIWSSMGWDLPQFAHPSLVLNEDRTKMSKRKGDVSLGNYIKKGYLKEAMINFLVLLGWSGPNDREIWNIDELIEVFDLAKVHKAGAIFKIEKLNFFNGHYIRLKSVKELTDLIIENGILNEYLKPSTTDEIQIISPFKAEIQRDKFELMVKHAQARLVKLDEFVPSIEFYTKENLEYNKELFTNAKMDVNCESSKNALEKIKEWLAGIDELNWNLEYLKEFIINKITETSAKNGQFLWPMRASLTGLPFSPGAFEVAEVLGKEETLRRVEAGVKYLSDNQYT